MLGGYKTLVAPVHQGNRPRRLVWICLFVLAWLLFGLAVHAQNSAAISQGFQTDETNITAGAVVSLQQQNQARVQLANVNRAMQLVGVVGDRSLLALSSNPNQVQVVTSGVTPALVSNINGTIKTGDKITASPIDGVGMKATQSTMVVGTAQEDFDTIKTNEFTITDKDGKNQVVRTGLLQVQINVTYYAPPDTEQSFLPSFLQQIANSVAGRQVSVIRVLIGLLVLLLGFISSGVILYSSVQSSIISIGRNPLSENAVHKSMLQVGATALGILLVMVIAIYLVLTT